MLVIISGLSLPDVGVIVARCRGYRCPNFVFTFFSRCKFNRLCDDLAKYYWLRRFIILIASRRASRRPGALLHFPAHRLSLSSAFYTRPTSHVSPRRAFHY